MEMLEKLMDAFNKSSETVKIPTSSSTPPPVTEAEEGEEPQQVRYYLSHKLFIKSSEDSLDPETLAWAILYGRVNISASPLLGAHLADLY